MKHLHLLLLGIVLSTAALAGGHPFVKYNNPVDYNHRSIMAVSAADTGYRGFYQQNRELYNMEKKIHSGRGMTIAGIVMVGTSPVLLLAAYGCTIAEPVTNFGSAAAITGAICFYTLGVGNLLAGTPLLVIGAIRWSEGSFEKRLYTGTATLGGSVGPNGAGVKLTF